MATAKAATTIGKVTANAVIGSGGAVTETVIDNAIDGRSTSASEIINSAKTGAIFGGGTQAGVSAINKAVTRTAIRNTGFSVAPKVTRNVRDSVSSRVGKAFVKVAEPAYTIRSEIKSKQNNDSLNKKDN